MERIRPIAQKSEIANRRRRSSSSSNSSDIRQTAVVGRRRTIANVVGRYSIIIIIIIIIITILLLLCRCLPTGNCGVRMRRHRRRRLVPTRGTTIIISFCAASTRYLIINKLSYVRLEAYTQSRSCHLFNRIIILLCIVCYSAGGGVSVEVPFRFPDTRTTARKRETQ